jgi:hypothetical protein
MTFNEWWDKIGSGMAPFPDEDQHEHVHRVSAASWASAEVFAYWPTSPPDHRPAVNESKPTKE